MSVGDKEGPNHSTRTSSAASINRRVCHLNISHASDKCVNTTSTSSWWRASSCRASSTRTSYQLQAPGMSFFLMVPKLFLSDQTYSKTSEYYFLQVLFNIIDHNMYIKGVKVDIFFLVHFVVGFNSGSEWGWTYIPPVPQ